MVDCDEEEDAPPIMSAKKNELLSTDMRRTSEWILSQEIPSDITVHVGETSFSLHKFPLVSKSGYIRKIVSKSTDPDLSTIEIPDIPGGAEAFELAAKFCYGINFDISTENIAVLRCVSEFLEMTEEYANGNLITKTEAFLTDVALETLPQAISILHKTEHLLPIKETIKLEMFGKGRKKIEPKEEHEKRVVLETIVSLLPREKNAMSVSFLSMLLRAAIFLETTVECRLDLEKRMGLQLGQAVLDDLLIPSFSFTGDTLFDVDSAQRILMNFLENEIEGNHLGYVGNEEFVSPPPCDMVRVGKLLESYLAEIASDRNLSVSKFTSLAEHIPEHSRVTEDGMYRSIDIFLKAHPGLSDLERKKICGVMDCQKLSREACAHAAQNNRLPVQTVVQVLYYEQQRLHDVISTGGTYSGTQSPVIISRENQYTPNMNLESDELSRLKRENQDLKFEFLKMKMKLKEMDKLSEKSGTGTPMRGPITYSAAKPPLPKKSFIGSVSKKLGRLMRNDVFATQKGKTKQAKDRRHSIT